MQVAAPYLTTHVCRKLSSVRPEYCTPPSTAVTYRRKLGCGVVATELPDPTTSCRHTGQMYCSDVLHLCQCSLVAAAKMQTGLVRSSAYIRTEIKNSTRKISWTDVPRGYHAQANSRELKL